MATTVEIPDQLLREAEKLTGLTTKKAIINRALEEMVQSLKQRSALDKLADMDYNPYMSESEISVEKAVSFEQS